MHYKIFFLFIVLLSSCSKKETYLSDKGDKKDSKLSLMQFGNLKALKLKNNLDLSYMDLNISQNFNGIYLTLDNYINIDTMLYIVIKGDCNTHSVIFDNQSNEFETNLSCNPYSKVTKFIISLSNFKFKGISFNDLELSDILEIGIDKDFVGLIQTKDLFIINSLLNFDYENFIDIKILNDINKNFRINLNYLNKGYDDFKTFLSSKQKQMTITFSKEEKSKTFDFFPLNTASADLDFYSDDIGFIPDRVRITNVNSAFYLNSFSINYHKKEKNTPIKKDLGLVLKSKTNSTDYDLYSWSMFPQILVFDFANYDIQDLYLRRLAFYIEKKGYIGKILSNKELEGKHGWNAHDYSAKSLASFFTKAQKEGVRLNKEEYNLLDILLSQNILQKSDNEYIPISGSIISISKESQPSLRREFLSHEPMHGLYFINQDFVEKSNNCFNSLKESQRKSIKRWFEWYSYNPKDDDLMANEFQAYTLQQTFSNINTFENKVKSRLEQLGQGSDEPLFLGKCAIELNDYLYKKFGIYGDGIYQVLEKK